LIYKKSNKTNTMKNTETIASAIHTNEFKKNILNQSVEKINDILKKTEEIYKINAEFYGQTENMYPKTTVEQKPKKICVFPRGVEKRLWEILKERDEIFETINMLNKLSKTYTENLYLEKSEQISWTDIRLEIQEKIKKIIYI